MTEQSDAELDRLWEQVKLAAPSSLHRCYARTVLAALAGPLEQPQEPKSDKSYLTSASGGDASKTALAKNDESEMARCLREAIDYLSDTDPDSEFIARCRAALGDA